MKRFPAKWYEFICPNCGNNSKKPLRTVIHNWKQAKSGPYCGKKCARRAQVMKQATMTGLNPVAQ